MVMGLNPVTGTAMVPVTDMGTDMVMVTVTVLVPKIVTKYKEKQIIYRNTDK